MTSLAQQIRELQTTLENIDLLAQFDQENLELLENIILSESTLMQLAGDDPAGRNLAKYLHRFHKLADQADLQPWPLKNQPDWNAFKEFADNILIIQAENGWAFYKPVSETQRKTFTDLEPGVKRGYYANNSQDSEFYIAFNNGKIMTDTEIDAEINKLDSDRTRVRGMPGAEPRKTDQFYRQGTRRGGKSATALDKRGANMFDTVKELVGPKIKNVWMARQREDLTTFDATRKRLIDKAIADLGLGSDPKQWSYEDKHRVRKLLARSSASLGGGKIGKQVFGPGASVEPAKIAQRRPEEALDDRGKIIHRLHALVPNLFSQIRILLKRRGADSATVNRFKNDFDQITSDPDAWKWGSLIDDGFGVIKNRHNIPQDSVARDIASDPALMQELITNIRDQLMKRYV